MHSPPKYYPRPNSPALEYPGDDDDELDAERRARRQRRQQRQQALQAQAGDAPPQDQGQGPPGADPAAAAPPGGEQPVQGDGAAAAAAVAAGAAPGAQPGAPPATAAAAAAPGSVVPGFVIPPQPVGSYVPYGTLGPEARMAAMGQPPEVPPTTPPHLRKSIVEKVVAGAYET